MGREGGIKEYFSHAIFLYFNNSICDKTCGLLSQFSRFEKVLGTFSRKEKTLENWKDQKARFYLDR